MRFLAVLAIVCVVMGCATGKSYNDPDQITAMSDQELLSAYQNRVAQVYKSAASLQRLNASYQCTYFPTAGAAMGGGLATLMMGSAAAANGRGAALEARKLKIEIERRGLAVPE